MKTKYSTLNRSFARRIGKHLSNTQLDFLTNQLPKHLINVQQPLLQLASVKEIYLEIGFGMGEHLLNQIITNPDKHYIGCEPYMNGVANLLRLATAAEVNNYSIWPDDVDLILDNLPDNSLNGVYILFPDPWPKSRQQKRRLVNEQRVATIYNKLKFGGSLYFASDIYDYATQVQNIIISTNFTLQPNDVFTPHHGYIKTKYHSKALLANLSPKFLQFIK